jgi:4'-phosphopantetheinyl transferase
MDLHWYEQSLADISGKDNWLSAWEKSHLAGLRIPKRYADWRLGRWTCKNAAAHYLAVSSDPALLATIEIRPEPSGAPLVFIDGVAADVSISLSHREGVAACVVGPSGAAFGCDLEAIEPRSEAFIADYLTPEEQATVEKSPAFNQARVVALIWSAKESALKALRVGLRANTRCVSVDFADQPEPAHFENVRIASCEASGSVRSVQQWYPLRVTYSNAAVFRGWWFSENMLVRTLVNIDPVESRKPAT